MVRTVKKAVSAAMALVMTTGMFITGNSSAVKTYAAGEQQTAFQNEKYVQLVDDGQYNDGVTYDEGIILISNIEESTYSSRCKLNKKVSLSSDSVLAYYDKDGESHILENKGADGNKKYDAIYGTLSKMTYKYTIVEKDKKLGTIDRVGNQITLNNKQWYDDIDLYENVEEKFIYGLKENKDDNLFDYTLVSENGDVIFTEKDCLRIHNYSARIGEAYETYFMLFVNADGYATLIDMNGKVWSQGKKYVSRGSIYINANHQDMIAILMFDDEYGYYNYTTGEMFEKKGNLKKISNKETNYIVNSNGKTIVYNRYMEGFTLEGEYVNVQSINNTGKGKGAFILKNSENKCVNICNKDGSKWFDTDFEINDTRLSIESAEGVVITYIDGSKYFVPDGGGKQFLVSDLQATAIDKIKSVPGNDSVALSNMSYVLADFGVVFYRTVNSVKYAAVITKASGYTEAVYLEGGVSSYLIGNMGSSPYGYIYLSENADKTITLKDGSTVTCDKKILKMYNLYGDDVEEIQMPDVLYRDLHGAYMYNISGDQYSYSNGRIHKVNLSGTGAPVINKIGDTGAYIVGEFIGAGANSRRYRLFGADDKEIDIGLDSLYNNPDYGSIYLTIFSDGYVSIHYYDNSQKKTLFKMYTYFGEHVLDYSDYIKNYTDKAGTIYFVDNKVMRFKDISGVLNDSSLREDSTIKIETIKGTDEKVFKGLKENSSIEDVKKELPGLDISVLDSDGKELPAAQPVGTGCKIQVIRDGKVVDTATVVVKGDTDGSGTINVLDMEEVQKSILGIGEGLTGAYNEAARLTGKDKISVLDMEAIQKNILGLEMIN